MDTIISLHLKKFMTVMPLFSQCDTHSLNRGMLKQLKHSLKKGNHSV